MIKHVLSYGAGINSTALAIFLIENKLPLDYVVFADTGDELPETYDYLKYFGLYLASKGYAIRIVKVRNNDSLYERCMRRRVIPSQTWRWCTRDFKIAPIHAFYKSLKAHINQYMGIDYDEVHRIKDSKVDWITNLYPLIDNRITRSQCIEIITRAGFRVPIKSGCMFCPFNNKARLQFIQDYHPALFQKLIILERNGKHYPRQRLTHPSNEDFCGGECMT